MSRLTWRFSARRQRPHWHALLNHQALGPNHDAWQRYVRRHDIWFPPAVAHHILKGDTQLEAIRSRSRSVPTRTRELRRWAREAASAGDAAFVEVSQTCWRAADFGERAEFLQGLHRHLEMVYFGGVNTEAAPLLTIKHLGPRIMGSYQAYDEQGFGWLPRARKRKVVRRIEVNSSLLADGSPFDAVATVMHERVHDQQFMRSHGLAPAGHVDHGKLVGFLRNFTHPLLWLGRYRLSPIEQDAWASEALALLRYALRLDDLPEHREHVDLRTGLYVGLWRHLPYYSVDNPRPPLNVELAD